MARASLILLAVLALAAAGCGTNSDSDSNKKEYSDQRNAQIDAADACPPPQAQGGILTKEECGPAEITLTRGKKDVDLRGTCATGPSWFELNATTEVPQGKPDDKASRIAVTIGRRDDTAGAGFKPAPKDGTYTPIALAGSFEGKSFSAFRSSTATLRGGRTEGTVKAVESDGTKIGVTFTCRQLPSEPK